MLCIFCSEEKPPSVDHVFPLAIGGTVTTDRVCTVCNSSLGGRVDAALSDFFPVRMRRAKLGLAGHGGTAPAWYEMFLGDAKILGQAADRAQTTFNEITGKLDTRQLYRSEDVVAPDGQQFRKITLDERDKGQIPTIIQRERKRHGLPPLSDDALAAAAAAFTTSEVKNPVIQLSISVSFAYLRHAMIKIAYELAFLWLGELYLSDPLATELRAAIRDPNVASTDNITGYIGESENCNVFTQFWIPHEAHHLAYATILLGRDIVINVRVFDIYAAAIVVSHESCRYIRDVADNSKLQFLAIDSVTGRTISTSFAEETHRMAVAMRDRPVPLPDPLVGSDS
jgi:HNH endonuclease